ncbi:MAG: hypothetical protein IPK64_00150 [bacterium]|nr:hypothetical protein [bacterium]
MIRFTIGVIALLIASAGGRAAAQQTPEEFILYMARAQDLARQTLADATPHLGTMIAGTGPSSATATVRPGLGHAALSVGLRGAEFTVANPDYTVDDPSGADRVESAVIAAFADASIGLLHRDRGPRATVLAGLDLLLRAGLTLGDQPDITRSVDLENLKPIFGGGLRLRLLDGGHAPQVSLAAGASFLTERRFSARGQLTEGDVTAPYEVNLSFEESSRFLLLEVGKRFGGFAPYVAMGWVRHHLRASYDAVVVFDVLAEPQMLANDDVDVRRTDGLICAGFELGSPLGLVLEAGRSAGGSFGSLFLHLHR